MLFNRLIRAARLDVSLYEEVEADESLTQEAAIAVLFVAIAAGIGGFLGGLFNPDVTIGGALVGLIVGLIFALVGWVIQSYLVYFIGTSLFKGTATPQEVLRTLGYAQAPRALLFFSFIPRIGGIIALVVFFWSLVTLVVGARQALDIETGPTIVTCIIAFVVYLVLAFILSLFGLGGAVGLAALSS